LRHSDPRLTFGIYVHSDKERLKAVAAMLPAIEVKNVATTTAPAAKMA
jgi:hypothetical protein